jgi:serine/tyrosine/threonine adenylyltransferase
VLPNRFALRERVEPCAIVCRMAETWIRIGTFDLFRNRGDRETTRKLAEYTIEHVFGGEDNLPVPREGERDVNRFERVYREICRRNARTVAKWQAYGFMNGVLNTDNTSIYGLSLDFGPFAVTFPPRRPC